MKKRTKDIEDLLIRKDMLVRAENMNPEYLVRYRGIISKTSQIVFEQHHNILSAVGYSLSDVSQISEMFTLYYFGLYSITNNEKYFDRTWEKIEKRHGSNYQISNEEWDKIEKSNLVNFLRQHLSRFVNLCYRRYENIGVGVFETRYFVDVPEASPASFQEIALYGEDLGYKSISKDKFENLKRDANGKVRDENGLEVFKISVAPKFTDEDYLSIFDNNNNYLANPEDMILSNENNIKQSRFQKDYDDLDNDGKRKILKDFIQKNKGNPKYKEEVSLANKLLKSVLV